MRRCAALAGDMGCELEPLGGVGQAFGEDQARYVVTFPDEGVDFGPVPLTRIGLEMKAAIERLREQAANVE